MTIQDVPWSTLVERWQDLDELGPGSPTTWREDAIAYGYELGLVERSADRETLERLATEEIPKLRASVEH